jgi:FimV-like protein
MSKTKKILIAVIAVVVLIVGAVGAYLFLTSAEPTDTVVDHISLAENYLLDLNYEAAIAEYRAAIHIDPKNADNYIALAEVYIEMGDIDGAIAVLEEGLAAVEEEDKYKIQILIDELIPEPAETTIPSVPEPYSELEELPEVTGDMKISDKEYKVSKVNTISADESLFMMPSSFIHIISGGELIVEKDGLITIGDAKENMRTTYIYIEKGGKLTVNGHIFSKTVLKSGGNGGGIEVREGGTLKSFNGDIEWNGDSVMNVLPGAILDMSGLVSYEIFESDSYAVDYWGDGSFVYLKSEKGSFSISEPIDNFSYPLSFRYIVDSDIIITTDYEIYLGSIITNGHTVTLNCNDGFDTMWQWYDNEWESVGFSDGVNISSYFKGNEIYSFDSWDKYIEIMDEKHEDRYLEMPEIDLSLGDTVINGKITLTMNNFTWLSINSETVFGETGMIEIIQSGYDKSNPAALSFIGNELTVHKGTFGADINEFLEYLNTFEIAMFSCNFTVHFVENNKTTDYDVYFNGSEFSLTNNLIGNEINYPIDRDDAVPTYINPNLPGVWAIPSEK